MLDEQNMGALMHEEASAPAPESTVDIGRAVRVGRRRRRVRLAASGSVAALTAVAMVGGVAVLHGLAHAGRADHRLATGQTATPARPAAPAAFDPLVRTVDVSYLPDGLNDRYATINTTSQQLSYLSYGKPDASGDRSADREVDVYVFTPGGENEPGLWWLRKGATSTTDPSPSPSSSDPVVTPERSAPPTASASPEMPTASPTTTAGDPSNGEAGPRIADGPSYWQRNAYDSGGDATLAWRWASGAWAFVRVAGYGTDAAARPVAAKVAASVRTGLREAVAFPFTVRRPTTQLALRQSQVYWDGATFGASLSFSRDPSMETDAKVSEALMISSQSSPGKGGVDRKYSAPNTVVNGHKAFVSFGSDGSAATAGSGVINMYDVSGQLLSVEIYDEVTARYVTMQQAMALAASMAVVPGVSDRTNWTTSPLR
jgi:hypothetical protein